MIVNALCLLHILDFYLLSLLKTRAKGDRIFCFMLQNVFLIRCIMKMDHHCPWINNCCGHQNHASFTLFLLLVPLGCIHAAFIFVMTMYTQLYNRVSGHGDALPFLSASVMVPRLSVRSLLEIPFLWFSQYTALLLSPSVLPWKELFILEVRKGGLILEAHLSCSTWSYAYCFPLSMVHYISNLVVVVRMVGWKN